MSGALPLAGVRVLDFTRLVAGPVATRILADLGADVVKVEQPHATDAGDRRGGLTGSLNRGKRSLVLDLARPEGVALARRLAARADVVIDNFSARVMDALGLDYEALRALRPDVVCVRMTGFGSTGPARDAVSFGPTLHALAGYTALMAEPGGGPTGFGYSYADVASGNLGALAVLAALWRRRRTGAGALVDFSQLEAVAALVGPLLLERALDGGASAPLGNASQEGEAAPSGVYRCAGDDRWIAITIADDDAWRRFAAATAGLAWTAEPRFAALAGRLQHAAELDRLLERWTSSERAEDVAERLQSAGVAASLVADARDLCARDPQLAARGHFALVPTPEGLSVRIDGPPVVLTGTPAAVTGPGPLLGEHSRDVLRELLGLSDAALDALEASGTIRAARPLSAPPRRG